MCPLTLVFLELSHLLGLSVTHSGRLRVCVHESVCTCPAVPGASLLQAGGWRGHSPE